MKRALSLVLAVLLAVFLVACGQTPADESPAESQTPETAPATAGATGAALPAVAGDFYAVQGSMGYNSLFNAGEFFYELRPRTADCLVYRIDCATATRQVLCSVPGCTHDSESCPAWLPGLLWDYTIFAAGDTVYIYKYRTSWEELDWDTYYQNNVAPYLGEEFTRGGMTPEEFTTYQRNMYTQQMQPACLYAVGRDGTAQKRIDLSENLEGTVYLGWCDGAALYGSLSDSGSSDPARGYRVDLATGQVTNFALQPGESVFAAQGRRLMTGRFLTQEPLPDAQTENEAYQAALQNSTMECDWLDPATGQREKLLELPGKLFLQGSDFCGLAGGRLYFDERQTRPVGGSTRIALRAFDLAAGQWQEVPHSLPEEGMWLNDPTVVGLPGTAAQAGRYLWFGVSDENGNMRMQILDRETGALQETPLTPQQVRNQQDRGRLPLTDDGRFLLCVEEDEKYDFSYALIDAAAFLQGSTDWTPVTTMER